MKNKASGRTITISALIFVVSLAALITASSLWGSLDQISAAVAAAAVFGASYFAYQELDEISKSRHIDVADRLFDELNNPEIVEARRHIYQNLDKDPENGLKNLSAQDRDAMKRVLNSLDRVAFLTQEGWIPDELIMPWMHPMIAKSWEKLEPYVLYERERRCEPYYYEHAGKLAERCTKWRKVKLKLDDCDNKWVKGAL